MNSFEHVIASVRLQLENTQLSCLAQRIRWKCWAVDEESLVPIEWVQGCEVTVRTTEDSRTVRLRR